MQVTSNILLIKPANFNFNTQTESSNVFQNKIKEEQEILEKKVLVEFEQLAETLIKNGVNVSVFNDTPFPIKPDAIFPNNWVTFHADGRVVLYPMFAPNRQLERRMDIIEELKNTFLISEIIDLSENEKNNKFLEGTGSIVFDHLSRKAYACISPRTNKDLFIDLCAQLNYEPISFYSFDEKGKEIYHTNVMLCIGEKFAVVCLESVTSIEERRFLENSLISSARQIIDIDFTQMKHFAGNMLQLKSDKNKSILVLSQTAFDSLNYNQQNELNKYCKLLPLNIKTIETIGGGSARCMIAEIFLPLI
jgi:hypothetical protein